MTRIRVWINVVASCEPVNFPPEYVAELTTAYEPTPESPTPDEEWLAVEHVMRQVNSDKCEWVERVDVEEAQLSDIFYASHYQRHFNEAP